MKNFVQTGLTLTLTAPAALVSGAGFLSGSIFAVATTDAQNGAKVEAMTQGVFDLPKSATVTPAEGGKAYWDNTAKSVTTSSSSTTLIGTFTQPAAANDATCRVKLGIVA